MEINAGVPGFASSLARQAPSPIDQQAEAFEAVVLSEMLKPMFDSVKTPSLFGGSGAEQDIYGAMLNEQFARAIASRGGVGIADSVKAALIDLQSTSGAPREATS